MGPAVLLFPKHILFPLVTASNRWARRMLLETQGRVALLSVAVGELPRVVVAALCCVFFFFFGIPVWNPLSERLFPTGSSFNSNLFLSFFFPLGVSSEASHSRVCRLAKISECQCRSSVRVVSAPFLSPLPVLRSVLGDSSDGRLLFRKCTTCRQRFAVRSTFTFESSRFGELLQSGLLLSGPVSRNKFFSSTNIRELFIACR